MGGAVTKAPIVVLVCGGRAFADKLRLFRALDRIHADTPIRHVVQGGAQGADHLARQWAAERGVPSVSYHADWGRFGRSAGPRRNQEQLERGAPDLVLAMPGGSGTADMVRRAKAAGVSVVEDA
jgi:aspartokinase-like uncharacterized kinase